MVQSRFEPWGRSAAGNLTCVKGGVPVTWCADAHLPLCLPRVLAALSTSAARAATGACSAWLSAHASPFVAGLKSCPQTSPRLYVPVCGVTLCNLACVTPALGALHARVRLSCCGVATAHLTLCERVNACTLRCRATHVRVLCCSSVRPFATLGAPALGRSAQPLSGSLRALMHAFSY